MWVAISNILANRVHVKCPYMLYLECLLSINVAFVRAAT